jgi:hypothetical protein
MYIGGGILGTILIIALIFLCDSQGVTFGHPIRGAALLAVFAIVLAMTGCVLGPDRGYGHGDHPGGPGGAQRGEHRDDDRQRDCDPRDRDCQKDHRDDH